MAWSSTTWTGALGVDSYQKHADDFWEAVKERHLMLGLGGAILIPAAGANIQSAQAGAPAGVGGTFSMRYIQDWIETNCTSFVQSHDSDGSARPAGHYDDSATIDMWTFANLMQAVRGGAAAASFRRNVSDWSVVGKAVVSDRFDEWICNDIQDALNMLIWTKKLYLDWSASAPTETFTSDGIDDTFNGGGSDAASRATPALAIAAAKADWDADGNRLQEATVRNIYAESNSLYNAPSPLYIRGYAATRAHMYMNTTIYDGVNCDIDWYLYTVKDIDASATITFKDNSLAYVIEDKFGFVGTDAANTSDQPESSMEVGIDLSDGNYPDGPATWGTTDNLRWGFETENQDQYAVLRWNVANGFVYV